MAERVKISRELTVKDGAITYIVGSERARKELQARLKAGSPSFPRSEEFTRSEAKKG